MTVQLSRTLLGVAAGAAFLWIVLGMFGAREPESASWREMNAEIEAWLTEREAQDAPLASAASVAAAKGMSAAIETEAAPGASGFAATTGTTGAAVPLLPPAESSADAADASLPAAPSDAAGTPSVANARLDVNAATEEQLDALPGIGPSKAKAIVDYREAHGAFAVVDDLLNVRGIGTAILEKLRPLIIVSPAPSAGK